MDASGLIRNEIAISHFLNRKEALGSQHSVAALRYVRIQESEFASCKWGASNKHFDSASWSESLILTVFACLHVHVLLQVPVDILIGLKCDDTRQLSVRVIGSCPLERL